MENDRFSRRHGYSGAGREIAIRDDAPEGLRFTVLAEALSLSAGPGQLRDVVCKVLRKRPDPGNWSEYPNIWEEVQELVYNCEWFRVYDIAEAVCEFFDARDRARYSDALNEYMVDEGIGWQITGTRVVARGSEAFESSVRDAAAELAGSNRATASNEIEEALRDLSRRPAPDLTGAVQHGMGALECVARDVAGDPKATLGEILKRYPNLLPRPLDTALSQIWGYSSEYARHILEGRAPSREEAELVVGLAAVVATYLSRKK